MDQGDCKFYRRHAVVFGLLSTGIVLNLDQHIYHGVHGAHGVTKNPLRKLRG
jgi:hypothetical protein